MIGTVPSPTLPFEAALPVRQFCVDCRGLFWPREGVSEMFLSMRPGRTGLNVCVQCAVARFYRESASA